MYFISAESNYSSIPDLSSAPPVSASISSVDLMSSGRYYDGSVWIAPKVPNADFTATIIDYIPSPGQIPFYSSVTVSALYDTNGATLNPYGTMRGSPFDGRCSYGQGYPMEYILPHRVPVTVSANDVFIIASSTHFWSGASVVWYPDYWTTGRSSISPIAVKFPIMFLSAAPTVETFRPSVYGSRENSPGGSTIINPERHTFNLSDFDPTRIPKLFTEDTGSFSGYYDGPTLANISPAVSPNWKDLYLATRYYLGDDMYRWSAAHQIPSYASPGYGEYWGHLMSTILLKSLFAYNYITEGHDQDYRTATLRNITQWGIDLWSAYRDGREQGCNGGHMQGRKAIVMAAGILLNNEEMKNPDAYLSDYSLTRNILPGLGVFQEKHVFWSGTDTTYDFFPKAWWNGWHWGHNHTTYARHPSASHAYLTSSIPSTWDSYGQRRITGYAFGENTEGQWGQSLFFLVMGLTEQWSRQMFGATTQGCYGLTKPTFDEFKGLSYPLFQPYDYDVQYPNMFVSSSPYASAMVYRSYSLSANYGYNYAAYYFRKYRFSNEVHQYIYSKDGSTKYPIKYIDVKPLSGPYLTTNYPIEWGKRIVWEVFQAPSGAIDTFIHYGKILDTPISLSNGYKLYIDLNDPNAPAGSVQIQNPTEYNISLANFDLSPVEPNLNTYPEYGFQVAFNMGGGEYISTNVVQVNLTNDAPTQERVTGSSDSSLVGSTFSTTEDGGKIGVPTIKSYGSSYGVYGGDRLKDYNTPRDESLNNKDYKDVIEFKDFTRTCKDFILTRLGYPVVDVELDDYQIELSIDEAVSKLEYHAPDWMTQYAVFETSAGINVYDLPKPIADNLNDVWYRRDFFKFGASPGSLEYDFAIMFFTNNGLFNNYNVSQYLLMQQYLKQVKNVLGQMSSWQVVNNKYLHIWPKPENSSESVILEFRAFDPETIHHAYKSWVQRYALALAKEILGGIRSKYQTLPGPGGGTRLNGAELVAEAREDKQLLMEELTSSIEAPPIFDIF